MSACGTKRTSPAEFAVTDNTALWYSLCGPEFHRRIADQSSTAHLDRDLFDSR
jgi:hypothetical protein